MIKWRTRGQIEVKTDGATFWLFLEEGGSIELSQREAEKLGGALTTLKKADLVWLGKVLIGE